MKTNCIATWKYFKLFQDYLVWIWGESWENGLSRCMELCAVWSSCLLLSWYQQAFMRSPPNFPASQLDAAVRSTRPNWWKWELGPCWYLCYLNWWASGIKKKVCVYLKEGEEGYGSICWERHTAGLGAGWSLALISDVFYLDGPCLGKALTSPIACCSG